MPNIVYLNGAFVPAERATISVFDRGFLFGDGVYEVIPVYNGHLFRATQHLKRLQQSLDAIRLPYKVDMDDWQKLLSDLVLQNADIGPNQSLYIEITRGFEEVRNHTFGDKPNPTILAKTTLLKTPPLEELQKGKKAITLEDTRWQNCYIKAIALLPNVLMMQEAKDKHCDEAILLRDGNAMEASSSNLFIVKDGHLITPPLSRNILGGITRDLIIELAKKHHISCHEKNISEAELRSADEVWLTGSNKEIYPIILLDDKPVGTGKVGDYWAQMIKHYHDYKTSMHYE